MDVSFLANPITVWCNSMGLSAREFVALVFAIESPLTLYICRCSSRVPHAQAYSACLTILQVEQLETLRFSGPRSWPKSRIPIDEGFSST